MISLVKAACAQARDCAQHVSATVLNAAQASNSTPSASSLAKTSAVALPVMSGMGLAAAAAPSLLGSVVVGGTLLVIALMIIGCCLDDSARHYHYHHTPTPYVPLYTGKYSVGPRVYVPTPAPAAPVAVSRLPLIGAAPSRAPAHLPSTPLPRVPGGANYSVGSRPLAAVGSRRV